MARPILGKLPVKVTLPILLALPVLVVATVLSALALRQDASTAIDLADQDMQEIHSRVAEQLSHLLNMLPSASEFQRRLFARGIMSMTDLERNRGSANEALNSFSGLSSVVIGKATGEAMWVVRYRTGEPSAAGPAHDEQREYGIKNTPDGPNAQVEEYSIEADGRISGRRLGQSDYDTTSRPWFRAAAGANQPVWSSVYVWLRRGQPDSLGVAYAAPQRDPDGKLVGVVACELTLADIAAYLRTVPVSKTGRAFIVEPDGNLVAASHGLAWSEDGTRRIRASESTDAYVASIGAQLEKQFGMPLNVPGMWSGEMRVGDDPVRVVISRYRNQQNLSWYIVTLAPNSDFLANVMANLRRNALIAAAAIAATLLLGVAIAMLIARPFVALVDQIRRIGAGEIDREVNLDATPEFAQLSREINTMTGGLRNLVRVHESLARAKDVQQSLLPATTPTIPGMDIAGHSTYCHETGGDYYDFPLLAATPPTGLTVVIGDVMGHGIAAAMFMATARGILQSHCRATNSPGELLTHLNALLAKDVGAATGRFMTLLIATIDPASHLLRWASAGHEPPIVYDASCDQFVELGLGGPVLALTNDAKYEDMTSLIVRPGQVYLLATDGVWETFNPSGDQFGMDRVQAFVRETASLPAADISQRLQQRLAEFRAGKELADDLTFVVVKIL